MTSSLVLKEIATPTPVPKPVLVEKAVGEPKTDVTTPVLGGLSKADDGEGADSAPAKKKPKRRKKKAAATSVASLESGSAETESVETETAEGGPSEGGAKPKAVAPVAPVLTPEERRQKVETLLPDDKVAIAAEWNLTVDSEKFDYVMRSNERYQYFLALSPEERAYVTTKQILKRQKPPPAEVEAHALQQRLLSVATIRVSDYAHLEKLWGVARSTPQFKAALSKDTSYQMFNQVPKELRSIVSGNRVKKGTLLDVEEVKAARVKRAEIQKAEKEALEAQKALAQNAKKSAANKLSFEEEAKQLRLRIAARVAAEIPDFVWEDEFDKSVQGSREKVNTGALAKKQSSQIGDRWDTAIDEAKKVRDVNAAAGTFARLLAWKLKEIKEDVLADSSQTAADFVRRAAEALSEQRNPSDIEKWKSWLQLTMYPKYKTLSTQKGFAVHFTVAANSVSLPALVTDKTTPAQLLNSFFRAPSGEKMHEAHVSLETGITDVTGTPKNPHKYWNDGPTEYELYFGKGADRTARWDADTDEQDVKDGLDAAMQEAYDALLARAKYVLDQAGVL